MRVFAALLALIPVAAPAESLVATHLLRAGGVIAAGDVALVDAEIPGAVTSLQAAVGQEVKTTIYAGRPITPDDIGAPTLVDRNQLVALVFQQGGLAITAEGRALSKGGLGDVIRVMNTSSHTVVKGVIGADGRVRVGPKQE